MGSSNTCLVCKKSLSPEDSFSSVLNEYTKVVKGGYNIHYYCGIKSINPKKPKDKYSVEHFSALFSQSEYNTKIKLIKELSNLNIYFDYIFILQFFGSDYPVDVLGLLWYNEDNSFNDITKMLLNIKRESARSYFLSLNVAIVEIPQKYFTPNNIITISKSFSCDGERIKIVCRYLKYFVQQNISQLPELLDVFETDAYKIKALKYLYKYLKTLPNNNGLENMLTKWKINGINNNMETGILFSKFLQNKVTAEMLIKLLILQFQCCEIKLLQYDIHELLDTDAISLNDKERLTSLAQKESSQCYESLGIPLTFNICNKDILISIKNKIVPCDTPVGALIIMGLCKKDIEAMSKFLGLMVYIDSCSSIGNIYAVRVYMNCLDHLLKTYDHVQNNFKPMCEKMIMDCYENMIRRQQYSKGDISYMLSQFALFAKKINNHEKEQKCLERLNDSMFGSPDLKFI